MCFISLFSSYALKVSQFYLSAPRSSFGFIDFLRCFCFLYLTDFHWFLFSSITYFGFNLLSFFWFLKVEAEVIDLKSFFSNEHIYWYTVNLSTALPTSHKFWYAVVSFSFHSEYFLISLDFFFDPWLFKVCYMVSKYRRILQRLFYYWFLI